MYIILITYTNSLYSYTYLFIYLSIFGIHTSILVPDGTDIVTILGENTKELRHQKTIQDYAGTL